MKSQVRWCALVVLVGAMISPSHGVHAQQPTTDRIVTNVTTRNDNGRVFCSLFRSAEGFPGDPNRAAGRAIATIQNRRAVCTFDVPPGNYAIAVFHDENNNGRLDTGVFGIPTEGYAASNNARGFMGPPRFDAARFVYRGGGVGTVNIQIPY